MNEKLRYFLCGLLMGIADTIPGVSGGTIAFITGIYGKLLDAIKSADREFFKLLFTLQIRKAFAKIPWIFVLPLLCGIGLAICSFAHVMVMLLEQYTDIVWAFFFGLIFSSLLILMQEVKDKNPQKILSGIFFALGAVFAVWLGFVNPVALSHSFPIIFASGFVAICAMILPGISGAFILVLIGQYHYILNALITGDWPVVFLFLFGCLCGILSFAHVLSACLNHFHHVTLAFLSGILAGSLVMLWPFETGQSLSYRALLGLLLIVGIIIPVLINWLGKKRQSE